MSVIAKIEIPAEDVVLAETFQQIPEIRFELENVAATEAGQDWSCVWATGASKSELEAALRRDPSVEDVSHVESNGDNHLYSLDFCGVVTGHTCFEEGGVLLRGFGVDERWRFDFRFPSREDFSRAHSKLEEDGTPVTIHQLFEITDGFWDKNGLTDMQREVLMLGFEKGYFDIPRRITLEELADEVGISHQAMSERFRRAYHTLVENELKTDPSKSRV